MEKRAVSFFLVFAVAMWMISGNAFAETIEGKVTYVDAQSNSLYMQKTDLQKGRSEMIDLSIAPTAQFKGGAASLSDIKAGDSVKVEVSGGQIYGSPTAEIIQRL